MRIKTHPDKFKKPDMAEEEKQKIDAEASKVGWAADVLSDPEQVIIFPIADSGTTLMPKKRKQHDHQLKEWNRRFRRY